MPKPILAWGPSVVWAVFLFVLSAFPGWTRNPLVLAAPDKLLHFAVYAVLGSTLAHGRYHGAPRTPHWVLVAVGVAYAATDEWHQAFVPRRVPSMGDWIADIVGIVVGYTVSWLVASALLRRLAATEEGTTV